MSRCDPLALAEEFIGKLRALESDAEKLLDGIPNTLEDLLQCIAFGTAGESTQVLDDTEAFDFDALKDRVDQIFDSVSSSTESLKEQYVSTEATEALAAARATSGLWLLSNPANAFYGLAQARTERAMESALALEPVLLQGEEYIDELTRIADQLTGPEGEELVRRARLMVEETCPEIADIQVQLRAISDGVASTRDLAGSMCGATSLQQRLRVLIASLPSDVAATVRLYEAAREVEEQAKVLDVLTGEMNAAADSLEAWDAEFEAGSFSPQTEQRMYSALAQQFADVCEEVAALAEQRRYAEMVGLEPQIRDISAIAITTLDKSPESRIKAVRDHDARDGWNQWRGALSHAGRVQSSDSAMVGLFGSLPGAIVDKSDDLLLAVKDVEKVFADARRLQDIYLTAGSEFLGLTQEFVDQACTGALRKLLFKYGYDTLNDLYANGLFKDLPEALYRTATIAGEAVDCLRGLVDGSLGLLEPLTGEQRFAIEASADVMRVMENSAHLIARLGQELDLKAPSPGAVVAEVSDLLERELKGALRGVGISLPSIPSTEVEPDGFVSFVGDVVDLPAGIIKEASGFLKAESGAVIPDGYGKSPEGYLIATP